MGSFTNTCYKLAATDDQCFVLKNSAGVVSCPHQAGWSHFDTSLLKNQLHSSSLLGTPFSAYRTPVPSFSSPSLLFPSDTTHPLPRCQDHRSGVLFEVQATPEPHKANPSGERALSADSLRGQATWCCGSRFAQNVPFFESGRPNANRLRQDLAVTQRQWHTLLLS